MFLGSIHSSIPSQNVLRYSQLLDELRNDPDTLERLRHEVEQLMLEQLAERGIRPDQTRLSTNDLNDRLLMLRRDREYLAKKHVDFNKIRDVGFIFVFLLKLTKL